MGFHFGKMIQALLHFSFEKCNAGVLVVYYLFAVTVTSRGPIVFFYCNDHKYYLQHSKSL